MKRILMLLCFVAAGCGYTTGGLLYQQSKIHIYPVVNKINITREINAYSSLVSYPVLLEKKLTSALTDKFNEDGHLTISDKGSNALNLRCEITNYKKEPLRYTNNDKVIEQRLRLYVHCSLRSPDGKIIKQKYIVGEDSYFLSGKLAKSESAAWGGLITDTARRILEAVVEEW